MHLTNPRHFPVVPRDHAVISHKSRSNLPPFHQSTRKSRHLFQYVPRKACLMLIPYPYLRAIRPRRVFTSQVHHLHSFPISTSTRIPRIQPTAHPSCRSQNRGKKTKSSLKLDDLPQGIIPLDPLPLEQDAPPSYSTVVQQARTNMRKFENCVLLTRVGGFYELYFEHAEEFASLLNLKEARRPTRPGAPVVPMV